MFIKSLSRATQKSNGSVTAKTFLHLSLSVFHSALHSITTTSMTAIRVFLLVVTQRLSKKCLMALMFLLTQTILNGLRIAIMQQVSRKRSLQDLSTNSITIAMVFSNIVLFALKQKFLIQITIRVTLW